MTTWNDWIGRSEVRGDRVDPALVARFCATIDREPPTDGLVPQGLHWCLATPDTPTVRLGADGHPIRDEDGLLPPIDLPRRMWASSKVDFIAPLRIGESIERRSRVAAITEKSGSTGRLAFVDIDHETWGKTGLAIRETQTLVYLEPSPATAGPSNLAQTEPFKPDPGSIHRAITPDEPLLFRYSALTFNTHRIHYDAPYATKVEGYRDLVVHGPLMATLLLDLARRHFGEQPLDQFAFRARSPAVVGEALHLTIDAQGSNLTLAVHANDAREVMTARAHVRASSRTATPI
jgi:3-methylfumaryl-CoA hydratase